MSGTTKETLPQVPPEEVARRIAWARRIAFQAKSPPVVVYHPPMQLCPSPGCGYKIAAITFQLETMVPAADMEKWLAAWWLGPGLIGRCPGCHNLVLFDVQWKDTVNEPETINAPQLPDDWYLKARLVPEGGR